MSTCIFLCLHLLSHFFGASSICSVAFYPFLRYCNWYLLVTHAQYSWMTQCSSSFIIVAHMFSVASQTLSKSGLHIFGFRSCLGSTNPSAYAQGRVTILLVRAMVGMASQIGHINSYSRGARLSQGERVWSTAYNSRVVLIKKFTPTARMVV